MRFQLERASNVADLSRNAGLVPTRIKKKKNSSIILSILEEYHLKNKINLFEKKLGSLNCQDNPLRSEQTIK